MLHDQGAKHILFPILLQSLPANQININGQRKFESFEVSLSPLKNVLYLDTPCDCCHVSECFQSRKVSVYCPQCQGDQVNWDQSFSVSALCEGCDISPEYIQYTWSLHLVSASSKPVIEGKKRDVSTWTCTVREDSHLNSLLFCSSPVLLHSGSQCSVHHHGGSYCFP